MAGYLGDRVRRFLGVGELVFNISAPVSSDVGIVVSVEKGGKGVEDSKGRGRVGVME